MSGQDRHGNGAGKQAYEARRAARAGVSLDRWLAQKQEARKDSETAAAAPARPNPLLAQARSVWRRLLDRAHRPL